MAQEIQEDLRLPLDPSGASWSLCGIAGQPVNLIGLCCNVPVEIGGFAFPHNFFISKDTLGEKDIIIGQPWLLNHAARFDYLPDTGTTVQFWECGDREGNSVLINIPLIKSSHNVFRAFVKEPRFRVTNISYASCAVAETNPFTIHTHNRLTWMPASPSYNAKIGEAPVIPRLGNFMINSFNVPDPEIEKFGPWASKLGFVNKYVTLNDPIYDALCQIWHANYSMPSAPSITDGVKEIGMAKGYEDYEADSFTKAFTRSTAKARYKPVTKKVIPISTYDPDSIVPEYKPLEIKDPGPLPLHL